MKRNSLFKTNQATEIVAETEGRGGLKRILRPFGLVAPGATFMAAASAWIALEWRSVFRAVPDSSYEPNTLEPLFSNAHAVLVFDEATGTPTP